MKPAKIVVDINAHIKNITCKVDMRNGVPVAIIGFDNLGDGNITAIKFEAVGYNTFGDEVSINGSDSFYLVIQDILINRNESARELKANLPNSDIRKLDLVESQICFDDGKVISYEGADYREFVINEYENNGTEREYLAALRDKFGQDFRYEPTEYQEGWFCGCGRLNKQGNPACSNCNNLKADIFRLITADSSSLIETYKKEENERAQIRKKQAKKKEKEALHKKIFIFIGIVLGILVLSLITRAIVLSGRTTYATVEEMKSALKGTYTYYKGFDPQMQLTIKDDTVIERWVTLGDDLDLRIEKWKPQSGQITITTGTITVLRSGKLKYDGKVYEKGSSSSSLSSDYSSSYKAEDGRSVLKIENIQVTSNGSYDICTGSVKNTGTRTYTFVEVKGAFKDEAGNVVDTDWTYAVGSEGIAPNESSTFRLSVDKKKEIKSCSVSLLDYE